MDTYFMKKTVIGTLLLSSVLIALAGNATTAKAEEVKENDNVFYLVESGDTLSDIASKYGVDFTVVHGNNTEEVAHADVINVGQKLLVGGKDFDKDKVADYSAPVVQAPVEEITYSVEPTYTEPTYVEDNSVAYSAPVTQAPASDDNWHRANRRMVETTNNYQWSWSNGYLGAYQFSPSTWNATASAHGLDPNDHSPANQDAMADAYANDRYGGWSNVPTTGGW